MTHPNLVLYWPAIIVSIIAAFIFGGLWYGPLFGKTWAKLIGMDGEACKPAPAVMKKAFTLQLLGTFLTVFVIAHMVQVWRPSVWGVGQDESSCSYGFLCGLFTWIGFYVPLQLGKISWEQRPNKLFWINAAHDFINLQIISQILANWR